MRFICDWGYVRGTYRLADYSVRYFHSRLHLHLRLDRGLKSSDNSWLYELRGALIESIDVSALARILINVQLNGLLLKQIQLFFVHFLLKRAFHHS